MENRTKMMMRTIFALLAISVTMFTFSSDLVANPQFKKQEANSLKTAIFKINKARNSRNEFAKLFRKNDQLYVIHLLVKYDLAPFPELRYVSASEVEFRIRNKSNKLKIINTELGKFILNGKEFTVNPFLPLQVIFKDEKTKYSFLRALLPNAVAQEAALDSFDSAYVTALAAVIRNAYDSLELSVAASVDEYYDRKCNFKKDQRDDNDFELRSIDMAIQNLPCNSAKPETYYDIYCGVYSEYYYNLYKSVELFKSNEDLIKANYHKFIGSTYYADKIPVNMNSKPIKEMKSCMEGLLAEFGHTVTPIKEYCSISGTGKDKLIFYDPAKSENKNRKCPDEKLARSTPRVKRKSGSSSVD